jgi:hypothetical protein
VALLLGPEANLPRTWTGIPCYCGKNYAAQFDLTADAQFQDYGDPMPPVCSPTEHWWATTTEPHLHRPPCSRAGCGLPSVLQCVFHTTTGPARINVCKTHIQSISTTIDNIVQAAIFKT